MGLISAIISGFLLALRFLNNSLETILEHSGGSFEINT